MNKELPSFKNEEYNFESASTLDRYITPLIERFHNKRSVALYNSWYNSFESTS